MHLYKAKSNGWVWFLLLGAVFLAAVGVFLAVSAKMEETAKTEGAAMLYDALNSAVVSCYAIEGRYPASLDYLTENYGVQIDGERYAVTYEVFADNIRPDLSVVRKGEKN